MNKEEKIAEAIINILVSRDKIAPMVAKQIPPLFKDAPQEYFTDFMLDEDLVEKRDLLEALSAYYQVPWFDVEGYFFEHMLVHLFPKDFLLRNNIIPVEVDDQNILLMVASDPNDPDLLDRIGEYVSWDIQFNVGLKRHINDAVKEFADTSVTQVQEDEDSEAKRRLLKEEKDIEERGDDPSKEEE